MTGRAGRAQAAAEHFATPRHFNDLGVIMLNANDISDDDERRERAEAAVLERPSKKALEHRAALSAGEGTDWGTDLLPPADWQH
jgi:hypothetical protein